MNPADLVALFCIPFSPLRKPPAVPCADFTATVIDVWSPPPTTTTTTTPSNTATPPPTTATRFQPGDSVICFPTLSHVLATGGIGGLQGTIVLPARYAVKLPAGKTLASAAGLLLAGCTADVQISDCAVAEGQRVLVIGASGGVGTMAVQMVREKVGAEGVVVGVCSGRNEEMVKGLGADEVVDYTRCDGDLAGELARRYGERPFDCVIDTFGDQAVYKQCARYLKPEGMYNAASIHYADYTVWELLKSVVAIVGNTVWPRSTWLGGTGRRWKVASLMDPGLEMMERVVKLFGDGKLRVVVDSEWPFDKVHEGLDIVRSGHAAGKVIIKVNED